MSTTNNAQLRALFTLPPARKSLSTALAVPELPPLKAETGDAEVDLVIWLREIIKTGQPALIDKATQAWAQVKAPPKELERRYTAHLLRTGGPMAAAFGGYGFVDLKDLAKSSIKRVTLRNEALARFGSVNSVLADTPAEMACIDALRGLKRRRNAWTEYAPELAAARFRERADLLPHTLDDCLHVLAYESELYRMRHAVTDEAGDGAPAVNAYCDYAFGAMAEIPPRNTDEALRVFQFLQDAERAQDVAAPAILRNLIEGPRASRATPRNSAPGAELPTRHLEKETTCQ